MTREELDWLVSTRPECVWSCSSESDEMILSDAWKRRLGYAPADIPNTRHAWLDLIHPDDRAQAVAALVDAAARPGVEARAAARFRCRDAAWLDVVVRARAARTGSTLLGADEELAVTAAVGPDARALDTLPAMAWVADAAGHALALNRAWTEFTGRPAHLDRHEGWADSVHPDDLATWRQTLADAAKECRAFSREHRRRRRDSSYSWILEHAAPTFDPAGRLTGFIGVAVDISARKDTEERLVLAVEASPTAMVMVDPRGKIVLVNSQTERLFGYDRSELLGHSVEMLVPAPFRKVHPSYRQGFHDDPRARPMGEGRDLYGQRRDGSMVPVEIGLNPIHTAHGVYVLSSIVDISQRKKAEQALRESEARLSGVIDSAMDAIITVDSHQRVVLFNAAAERMFHCRADQAVGAELDRFIPARFRHGHRRHIEGFARTGTTSRRMGALGELKALRANGEEFPIEASISQIVSGGERLFTVIMRDITERARAETAVRENEERYRAISELTSDFAYSFRRNERGRLSIEWVTDAFAKITGYTPEELAAAQGGSAWHAVVSSEDAEVVARHIDRVLHGHPDIAEFRLVTRQGAVRWIRNHARPVADAAANVVRIVGAAQDITERRDAERRQAIIMAELDHRVKNNLSLVLSMATQTSETATSLREFIDAYSGRLRALARVHGALASGRWEGANLREIVAQTLEVHTGGPDRQCTIEGDDVMLPAWQVQPFCLLLHELATNAVKYGALQLPSGLIAVRWHSATDTRGRTLLTLNWEESGGPPVTPPAQRGFGTVLIEKGVAYELRGTATLEFKPGGVRCQVTTPLAPSKPGSSASRG